MSSFKEIVFIVQKTQTQSIGYERVAIELAKTLDKDYVCKLKIIPFRIPADSTFIPQKILHFIYTLRYLFKCIQYAVGSDVVYFFGKKPALSLPIIKLISRTKVLAQIQYQPNRLVKKKGIARFWARFKERIVLRSADRVFVDSKKAQLYFKEEYKNEPLMTFYGSDHERNWEGEASVVMPTSGRKYAVAFMPNSTHQALMALRSFAQYPKYDYYLVLEADFASLPEEVQKFDAYAHIHMVRVGGIPSNLFQNAYLYLHLEPSVKTRIRLIEAMVSGKFILCLDTDFSRNITQGEAFYFNDHSQLLSCLQQAVTKSHFNQGNRMKDLVLELSWARVAENLDLHIKELLNAGLVLPVPNAKPIGHGYAKNS